MSLSGKQMWVLAIATSVACGFGCDTSGALSQGPGTGQQPTAPGPSVAPGGADANGVVVAPSTGGLEPNQPGTVVGAAGGRQPGENGTLSPNAPVGTVVVPPADTMTDSRYPYAFVGRFDLRNPNQVRFNLPGSKVGVAFTGTSLGIRLTDTGADTFNVNIDGTEYASPGNVYAIEASAPLLACKPVAQVPAWDGNNTPGCVLAVPSTDARVATTYPIATGLSGGNHVAWITKRSEFYQNPTAGTTTLWGFALDDNATLLPPPAYKKRRIEVSGDSSTSGYGAGQRNPCSYTSRNSDAGRDIPSYLAQYLHAESVNLSSSGQGVYRSMYDHNLAHNLPVLYRQTVGFDASLPWDFNADHVDVVVLSAGGDDLWGDPGTGVFSNNDDTVKTDPQANFVAAYVDWLATVRQLRPSATIFAVLTHGATKNDIVSLGGALQQAVAARNAAGDANVLYYTYFPANDPARNPNGYASLANAVKDNGLWYGCKYHPSPVAAKYLAGLLGPTIAKRMGWQDVGY